MMRTLIPLCVVLGLSAPVFAGDYTLNISQIDARKTPQSGTWRAGVNIWQESEPDNGDAWHGGEDEFKGANAVLPAILQLDGLSAGEKVVLFVGVDDDAEDAGNTTAEDKLEIPFKVFPSKSKEKVYSFKNNDWSLRVHYTLTKE
jgi:hypothetical protein